MSFWRWHNENEPKRGYWHKPAQEVRHVPTTTSNSTLCSSASRLSNYEGQDGRFHRTHHTHHRHRHHRGHGHHHHHHHHHDNHHDHHGHHHHGHDHHGHHHHGHHHHRHYRYRTYPRRRYYYRNSDSANEHLKREVRAVDSTLTPTTDYYDKNHRKTEWCSREGRYVLVGNYGRVPVKYTKRVYPAGKPYETVKEVVEKPVGYKHVERTVSRPVHKDYVKTVQRHENGRGYGVVRRWEYVEPVVDEHGHRIGHKHVSHRSHRRHRTHYPYEHSDYTHNHRHSHGYSHTHPHTHGHGEHR